MYCYLLWLLLIFFIILSIYISSKIKKFFYLTFQIDVPKIVIAFFVNIIPIGTLVFSYQLCLLFEQNKLLEQQNLLSFQPDLYIKLFEGEVLVNYNEYNNISLLGRYYSNKIYNGYSANSEGDDKSLNEFSGGLSEPIPLKIVNIGKGVAKDLSYSFELNQDTFINILKKYNDIKLEIGTNNKLKKISHLNNTIDMNRKIDIYFENKIEYILSRQGKALENISDRIYIPYQYTAIYSLLINYYNIKNIPISDILLPNLKMYIKYKDLENNMHLSTYEIDFREHTFMYREQYKILPFRVVTKKLEDILINN